MQRSHKITCEQNQELRRYQKTRLDNNTNIIHIPWAMKYVGPMWSVISVVYIRTFSPTPRTYITFLYSSCTSSLIYLFSCPLSWLRLFIRLWASVLDYSWLFTAEAALYELDSISSTPITFLIKTFLTTLRPWHCHSVLRQQLSCCWYSHWLVVSLSPSAFVSLSYLFPCTHSQLSLPPPPLSANTFYNSCLISHPDSTILAFH